MVEARASSVKTAGHKIYVWGAQVLKGETAEGRILPIRVFPGPRAEDAADCHICGELSLMKVKRKTIGGSIYGFKKINLSFDKRPLCDAV